VRGLRPLFRENLDEVIASATKVLRENLRCAVRVATANAIAQFIVGVTRFAQTRQDVVTMHIVAQAED